MIPTAITRKLEGLKEGAQDWFAPHRWKRDPRSWDRDQQVVVGAAVLLPMLYLLNRPEQVDAGPKIASKLERGLHERFTKLSALKRQMIRIIEEEFVSRGLPIELAAAAIVNAYAESGLNPTAAGDGWKSIGLFQLNKQGAGKGMSIAERMDPRANTRRILEVLLGPEGKPVMDAVRAGERRVPRLAALFCYHVERPRDLRGESGRRAALARKFFPEAVA